MYYLENFFKRKVKLCLTKQKVFLKKHEMQIKEHKP